MSLPPPVYYSCLISVLVAGSVPTHAEPASPVPASTSPRQQSEPRAFQIPASDASEALQAFSLQAGTALVYVIEDVREVRTNGIEGRFFPFDALQRLLANTALTVAQDSRTGALMVKRASLPKPGANAGTQSPPIRYRPNLNP